MTKALAKLGHSGSDGKEAFIARVTETMCAMETNEELIKLRPGSEALWCQRRSLFSILFKKITEFAIEGLQLDSSDWAVLRDADWACGDDENTASIDEHCASLKESLLCYLLSLNSHDTSEKKSIESFIARLLLKERLLCSRSCADKTAWNFLQQKKYAFRYILYIIFLV